jgi:hypothetical protein
VHRRCDRNLPGPVHCLEGVGKRKKARGIRHQLYGHPQGPQTTSTAARTSGMTRSIVSPALITGKPPALEDSLFPFGPFHRARRFASLLYPGPALAVLESVSL